MYVLKAIEIFSKEEYAKRAEFVSPDYSEVIRVPLPEGKTFDDVSEWKMLDDGRLEYRMRDEDWYRTYQL
jgi:hypothetical protein